MSDKKGKKQYTKQDSAAFKAYQENLAAFPAEAADWVDDEFKLEFAEFQNTSTYKPKGKKVKESLPRNLEDVETKVPGYASTAQTEMSDAIAESSLRLEGLQSGYDKDYAVFQEDSTRYADVRTTLDILESEWASREAASPTTFKSMFNLYPEDSSMGILGTEISKLKGQEEKLYSKTFKKHGRVSPSMSSVGDPGISYEDKLKGREAGLKNLARNIAKKQEFYDSLQNIELDKKGY